MIGYQDGGVGGIVPNLDAKNWGRLQGGSVEARLQARYVLIRYLASLKLGASWRLLIGTVPHKSLWRRRRRHFVELLCFPMMIRFSQPTHSRHGRIFTGIPRTLE
jgi:hypothetical protein